MKTNLKKNKVCRICLSSDLKFVFSLNPTAPANALRKTSFDKFNLYPLEINFCKKCKHLQLAHLVNSKILFSNYLYTSSASQVYLKYLSDYANRIIKMYNLIPKKDIVCDVASNDGSFLYFFKQKKFLVQGIEPAKNLSKISKNKNINTANIFLKFDSIRKYKKFKNKFKIITANHVFAHVENLNDFFKSVNFMLARDGVFIFEVGYLYSVIKNIYFDTIYHEHVDYHHFHPLEILCKRNNYKIIHVEQTKTQGGSLRVHCTRINNDLKIFNKKNILLIRKIEKDMKLNNISTYYEFANKIKKNKKNFFDIAHKYNFFKKNIIGYGAPAKVTTFLSYYNFPEESIKFIIDDSKIKKNMYLPCHNIQIKNFEILYKTDFDVIIIFAWNFKESIINKLKLLNKNFKIIIPFPKTKIIKIENANK